MNVLIVGGGSKFGAEITTILQNNSHDCYVITSNTQLQTNNILCIDWTTCGISDFEKFLRGLPDLDLIIFNQNSTSITEDYLKLNSSHIFKIWQQSKQWSQSYYVNCILPMHMLHTLTETKKLTASTKIVWMLSGVIFTESSLIDYVGQKYQNYISMKELAKNNIGTYIGIVPTHLSINTTTATVLVNFLTTELSGSHSGKLFAVNTIDKLIENIDITININYNKL